jgi:hypothetical protein
MANFPFPDGIYGMDCTFENKFRCGWTQDNTDDFDWDETTGDTATSVTGPSFDHTLGQGKPGKQLHSLTPFRYPQAQDLGFGKCNCYPGYF